MHLILHSGKQKYFLFRGLTRFPKIGSDLPVGSFCRGLSPSTSTRRMSPLASKNTQTHQIKNTQTSQIAHTSENAAGTIRPCRHYRQRFEFRETSMKTAKIMLAGLATLTLVSSASAQQAMTGTVTRIDRTDGTIAIQLHPDSNTERHRRRQHRRCQNRRSCRRAQDQDPGQSVERPARRRPGQVYAHRRGWHQNHYQRRATVTDGHTKPTRNAKRAAATPRPFRFKLSWTFPWKGLSLLRADLGRLHAGLGFGLGLEDAVVDDGGRRAGRLGFNHRALLRGGCRERRNIRQPSQSRLRPLRQTPVRRSSEISSIYPPPSSS